MISQAITDKFIPVTDEEKRYLSGENEAYLKIYTESGGSVINNKKLLKKGQLITLRQHARFIHFPMHSHDFVEVMYVCKGCVVHIIGGDRVEVREGELLLLGRNASHEIEASGEEDIALNFIILPDFFDSPLSMLKYDESPLRKFIVDSLVSADGGVGYMHFKVSDNRAVQNIIENLIISLTEDMPNKYSVASYTMGLGLLHLAGSAESIYYQADKDSLIIKVLKYADQNYKYGNLKELADNLHYDYNWLSKQIKTKTGKTYTEIVQERRMSQAVFLLSNTNMKISDIAVRVGYDNISYFHRLFNKMYGKSPKEYRANKDTF